MSSFDKVKYNNEYNKENYKRCIFNVPKGKEILIETHFKAKGYKSLNSYINALIDADKQKAEESQTQKQSISINNNHSVVMGDNNGTMNL